MLVDERKWGVNWDTGLSPREYYQMVCEMNEEHREEHREELFFLTSDITKIEAGAFWNCTSLALTKVPDNVTTIEGSAFKNCTSLALTKRPDNVTFIGKGAFINCTLLALTELPYNVNTIKTRAFMGGPSLDPSVIRILTLNFPGAYTT